MIIIGIILYVTAILFSLALCKAAKVADESAEIELRQGYEREHK